MAGFFYVLTNDQITIRCGIWGSSRLTKKGAVVLLSGRTEYMEKYLETISELNQRGFDVYSFDWRGQGLSTRILPDRLKGFINSFDEYLQDFHFVIKTVIPSELPFPLYCIGHSMGGHLALRYICEYPPIFKKAIVISPMIDIETYPTPRSIVKWLIRLAVSFGRKTDYIIGSGNVNSVLTKFEGNLLTSDPVRFYKNNQFLGNHPQYAINGVTWGWVHAAFESIETIMRYDRSKPSIPVLMIGGSCDKVVSVKGIYNFCNSHVNCEFRLLQSARHEILLEKDEVRNLCWDCMDRFLNAHDNA